MSINVLWGLVTITGLLMIAAGFFCWGNICKGKTKAQMDQEEATTTLK